MLKRSLIVCALLFAGAPALADTLIPRTTGTAIGMASACGGTAASLFDGNQSQTGASGWCVAGAGGGGSGGIGWAGKDYTSVGGFKISRVTVNPSSDFGLATDGTNVTAKLYGKTSGTGSCNDGTLLGAVTRARALNTNFDISSSDIATTYNIVCVELTSDTHNTVLASELLIYQAGEGDPPPPPPPSGSTCLIGIAGQSLAAKYNGPTLYTPRNASRLKMLNVQTGVLAAAVDPVGINGSDGTSFVLPLADLIADAFPTKCGTVVVANFAIGGSTVAQWAPGGGTCGNSGLTCSTFWASLVSAASTNSLTVTAILWSQGPQDAVNDATTRAGYRASMSAVIGAIRSAGMTNVPVFLETQTVANTPSFARREVAAAIAGLVDPTQKVFEGPNTDILDCSYRRDCIHANDIGVRAWAYLWMVPLYKWFSQNQ